MHIELIKSPGHPLYISLYEAVAKEIYSGQLCSGARLPSRRALAKELGIAENTVDAAYRMLADTGCITALPRQGYIVTYRGTEEHGSPWETDAPEAVVFSPNGIDISRINRGVYAKLLRDIAYNEGAKIFSYPEKGGEFELRSAISRHLYSFRDIKCSPDRIIIGAGAEYMLISLAAVFDRDAFFVTENPADMHFYRALSDNRIPARALPASTDSFDLDALYRSGGKVLLFEPGARFPRGKAVTETEKNRLFEWAENTNGYIIENGIDDGIRYKRTSTLFSSDKHGRVIYLGSFSRSFCPAVKTSYMVLPAELMERWKKRHTYYYALTSIAEQLALAELLNKGHYTKHCRAMRALYHEKKLFLAELVAGLPDIIPEYCDGSTYITADCRGKSAAELKQAARRCGVKLFSMDSYTAVRADILPEKDRLVIGFGDLGRNDIKTGIRLLDHNLT